MLPDISNLTYTEKKELAFNILKDWPGPIEVPDLSAGNGKGFGIFPLYVEVPAGQTACVQAMVNRPFKPFRIVILETTRTWDEVIPAVIEPAVTKKTWWGLGKTKVVKYARVVEPEKRITHTETVPRNRWTVGDFFIGDNIQLLNNGRFVNGDAFAPGKSFDYEFTTAQRGHGITMRVMHSIPNAKLTFNAIMLGTEIKGSEEFGDFQRGWKLGREEEHTSDGEDGAEGPGHESQS